MNRWHQVSAVLFLVLPSGSAVFGQDVSARSSVNADLTAPTVDIDTAGSSGVVEPAYAWSVDLVAGLPTGLRLQRAFPGDGELALLLEGFAGLEVIIPMAGVGIRPRLPIWQSARDALLFNPGIDAYLLWSVGHGPLFGGGPPRSGMFAADIDLVWRHDHGEIGIKAGAGAIDRNERTTLPVIGVIGGWRF